MHSAGSVARVYAQALFEVAAGRNLEDVVGEEMDAVGRIFDEHPEFRDALGGPVLPVDRKKAILRRTFKDRVSELFSRFLILTAEKHRTDLLPSMRAAYQALLDERRGRARVGVRTAQPMTDETTERVRAVLAERLNKDVVLESDVDPGLLGGLVAQCGNLLFDASLSSRIEDVSRRLVYARPTESTFED